MADVCTYKFGHGNGSLSEADLITITAPKTHRLEFWSLVASAAGETIIKIKVNDATAMVLHIPATGTIEIEKREGEFILGSLNSDDTIKVTYQNVGSTAETSVTICYRLIMAY